MHCINYFIVCAVLAASFIQTGCSQKSMKDTKADTKLDAPLRMKLDAANQANVDSPLQCLVKLNSALDEGKKKLLKNAGVKILTVLPEIITVEGAPEAIRKVANLDFVHSISLSQTSQINQRRQ